MNGTWSPLAPMHHTRLYYASAVLRRRPGVRRRRRVQRRRLRDQQRRDLRPGDRHLDRDPPPAGWSARRRRAVLRAARRPPPHRATSTTRAPRSSTRPPTRGSTGPRRRTAAAPRRRGCSLPDEHRARAPSAPSTRRPRSTCSALTLGERAEHCPVDLVEAVLDRDRPGAAAAGRPRVLRRRDGHTRRSTPCRPIASQPGTWAPGPTFPYDAAADSARRTPRVPDARTAGCSASRARSTVAGDSTSRPTRFFEFDGKALNRVPTRRTPAGAVRGPHAAAADGPGALRRGVGRRPTSTRPDGAPDDTWRPDHRRLPDGPRPERRTPCTAAAQRALAGRRLRRRRRDRRRTTRSSGLQPDQRAGLATAGPSTTHHGGRHRRGHPLDEVHRPLRDADSARASSRSSPTASRRRAVSVNVCAVPLAHPVSTTRCSTG